MNKDDFADLLDRSWQGFRQELLDSYPIYSGVDSPSFPRHLTTAASYYSASNPGSPASINGISFPASLAHAGPVSSLRSSEEAGEGETSDQVQRYHGDSAALLGFGLKDLSPTEVTKVKNRLRLRLGATSSNKLVSGKSLYDAVVSLGLTMYLEEDMNDLVNHLADFIGLYFEPEEGKVRRPSQSLNSLAMFRTVEDPRNFGKPKWKWPGGQSLGPQLARSVTKNIPFKDGRAARNFNVVPAQALMDVFLSSEADVHKRIFGPALMNQFQAMILLAGDTNRLVAELTFVRINDLAVPPEPLHPLMYIEPFVAILIVLNGIMIGFQTDPGYEDWSGWRYVDLAFQSFLLLEILLRMHLQRCRKYWWGPESYWNWFDLFLFGSGLADVILQFAGDQQSDIAATSLLRFCRLIRLVRIVKVFRIKFMRDLRLMVKGLIAGVRTLALAFVLLFAVLYVISGFAAMTIGSSQEAADIGLKGFFNNIPAAMFTAFRCYTGECTTNDGSPIHSLLAEVFGLPFIAAYVASYMLVAMGIFNLILAVYVDITMKAAKENDAFTAEQYSRESIRVARTTRELLKKFSSAYQIFNDMDADMKHSSSMATARLDLKRSSLCFTEEGMEEIAITKELFLLIIQDRGVQKLMDDLDLPPDRANLFEIIDADGSGTLQITELLHGLLKIRGEINKSDAVATLLATRCVQQEVCKLKEENNCKLDAMRSDLLEELAKIRKRCQSHVSPARPRASSTPVHAEPLPQKSALPAILELKPPCRPYVCEEDAPVPWPSPRC